MYLVMAINFFPKIYSEMSDKNNPEINCRRCSMAAESPYAFRRMLGNVTILTCEYFISY